MRIGARDLGPPFGVLVVNAIASCAVYGSSSGALLSRVLLHPQLADRAHVLAYAGWLFASASLVGLALAWLAQLVLPRRLVTTFAALACGLLVLGLYLDTKLYLFLGAHLYDRAVLEALHQSDLEGTLHGTRAEMAFAAVVAVSIEAAEVLLALACEKWWGSVADAMRARIVRGAVVCAAALVVMGGAACRDLLRASGAGTSALMPILPLHKPLFDHGPETRLALHAQAPLEYPQVAGARALGRKLDVLFLVTESLRSDAVSPERTPNIWAFMHQRECIQSDHHHSASNVTQLGIFSLLYGMDTYYYDAFINGTVPSYPLEVLKSNGYAVEGGCSAKITHWGDMSLMTGQLAPYFEPDGDGPAERDERLEAWGEERLQARDPNRPLFLFLFFDSTHFDYYFPPSFEIDRPITPLDTNRVMTSIDSEEVRQGYRNRYKNSTRYVDSLFGKLMSGPAGDLWRKGELLVVLTGDHGEELWDEGLWGHGGRFLKSRTQTPLLFCVPGADAPHVALSSHVDLMPTLLDALSPSPPLDPATFSTGVSLLGAQDPDRTLLISAQGLSIWSDELELVSREHKYALQQSRPDASGHHAYSLMFARGPDDERIEDAAPLQADIDARAARMDASFGSFFRR